MWRAQFRMLYFRRFSGTAPKMGTRLIESGSLPFDESRQLVHP